MAYTVHTEPTAEPLDLAEARAHLKEPEEAEDPLISALIVAARRHVENVLERALMPQKWLVMFDSFPDAGGVLEIPGGLVRAIDSVTYWDATTYTGTYSRAGNTVTVTMAGHSYAVGDSVYVSAATDSGLKGTQIVTAAAATFAFSTTSTGASSGDISVVGRKVALGGYQADLKSQPARLSAGAGVVTWPTYQGGRYNAVEVLASVGYASADAVPYPIKTGMLLLIADLFENREAAIVGTIRTDNPAVKALLTPYKRVVP